jgi:hypothetical protein
MWSKKLWEKLAVDSHKIVLLLSCSVNKQKCFSCVVSFCFVQQVEEKEGQLIMLDRHYGTPSSNRLLMFLQSPRGQMRGALDPSPDVGLSNLSPLVVGASGSSQEFVDGAKGSLCQVWKCSCLQSFMVELVVAFFHWVFDTCVLQDNVSDIVKEGGVQRLFDGELIVQVFLWCLPACVCKKIVLDPSSF